jgi:ribosomal protein RSM22 (predicted rRNA methylase)
MALLARGSVMGRHARRALSSSSSSSQPPASSPAAASAGSAGEARRAAARAAAGARGRDGRKEAVSPAAPAAPAGSALAALRARFGRGTPARPLEERDEDAQAAQESSAARRAALARLPNQLPPGTPQHWIDLMRKNPVAAVEALGGSMDQPAPGSEQENDMWFGVSPGQRAVLEDLARAHGLDEEQAALEDELFEQALADAAAERDGEAAAGDRASAPRREGLFPEVERLARAERQGLATAVDASERERNEAVKARRAAAEVLGLAGLSRQRLQRGTTLSAAQLERLANESRTRGRHCAPVPQLLTDRLRDAVSAHGLPQLTTIYNRMRDQAVRRSELLSSGEGEAAPIRYGWKNSLAFTAFDMLPLFSITRRVLRDSLQRIPAEDRRGYTSMLDFGGGPGTAMLAARDLRCSEVALPREEREREPPQRERKSASSGEETEDEQGLLPNLREGLLVEPSRSMWELAVQLHLGKVDYKAESPDQILARFAEERAAGENFGMQWCPSLPKLIQGLDPKKRWPQYDIVNASFALSELPGAQARVAALGLLWSMVAPGGVLVVAERGDLGVGQRIVQEARALLTHQEERERLQRSMERLLHVNPFHGKHVPTVVAPCTHQGPCPVFLALQLRENRAAEAKEKSKQLHLEAKAELAREEEQRAPTLKGQEAEKEPESEISESVAAQREAFEGRFPTGCFFTQESARSVTTRTRTGTGRGPRSSEFAFSYIAVHKPRAKPEHEQDETQTPAQAQAQTQTRETGQAAVAGTERPLSAAPALQEFRELGRILRPPMLRRKHVLLDVCQSTGTIDRLAIAQDDSEGGRKLYRAARKAQWGGLWFAESSKKPLAARKSRGSRAARFRRTRP